MHTDFAAGSETLLEQMSGNIAVPLKWMLGREGENLEKQHGEILGRLKEEKKLETMPMQRTEVTTCFLLVSLSKIKDGG